MTFPPIVLAILGIIQLALRYGPVVEEVYSRAKELISMWFAGGVITAAQQAELMNWADAHQAATLRGEIPPELVVEPDL